MSILVKTNMFCPVCKNAQIIRDSYDYSTLYNPFPLSNPDREVEREIAEKVPEYLSVHKFYCENCLILFDSDLMEQKFHEERAALTEK